MWLKTAKTRKRRRRRRRRREERGTEQDTFFHSFSLVCFLKLKAKNSRRQVSWNVETEKERSANRNHTRAAMKGRTAFIKVFYWLAYCRLCMPNRMAGRSFSDWKKSAANSSNSPPDWICFFSTRVTHVHCSTRGKVYIDRTLIARFDELISTVNGAPGALQ